MRRGTVGNRVATTRSTGAGLALALIVAGLAWPAAPARAQLGATGSTFAASDFLIRLQRPRGEGWADLTENDAAFYFNRARCECATRLRIIIEPTAAGISKLSALTEGYVELQVGPSGCLAMDSATRTAAACEVLGGQIDLTSLARASAAIETTVAVLFDPKKHGTINGQPACTSDTNQKLWLYLNADGDDTPDLTGDSGPTRAVDLDGRAPAAPVLTSAVGGNEALEVSWQSLTGVPDLAGYLVFCARGGQYAVFKPSGYDGQYHSRQSLCGAGAGAAALGFAAATYATDEGAPVVPPAALRDLDPAFLCSELLPSQSSKRVAILENGVPYVVGVAAVDTHGNASPIEAALLQTPIPTRDFYRGYRAEGGMAEGGYCALGGHPWRGGAPPAWPALAIAGGVLAGAWRRRGKGSR